MKKFFATCAAISLVASPMVSQAATAARVGTSSDDPEQLAGVSPILLAVIAAAVIAGVIIVVDDNNNNSPASP